MIKQVVGQQLHSALHSIKSATQHPRQRLQQGGFANPDIAFQQYMPTGEYRDQQQADSAGLTENDTL